MAESQPIDVHFEAVLGKVRTTDTWICVQLPDSATVLGTRARVKVAGTIDGLAFQGLFMPLGDGTHKLPVKKDIRRTIGKNDGDRVTIHLTQRLP